LRDSDWRTEGFLLIEFSNVLATYHRIGALSRGQAGSLLAEAERLIRGVINLPHHRALRIAERFGVSAYSARFLGAAESLSARLVTEDAKLRAAAPELTASLADALA